VGGIELEEVRIPWEKKRAAATRRVRKKELAPMKKVPLTSWLISGWKKRREERGKRVINRRTSRKGKNLRTGLGGGDKDRHRYCDGISKLGSKRGGNLSQHLRGKKKSCGMSGEKRCRRVVNSVFGGKREHSSQVTGDASFDLKGGLTSEIGREGKEKKKTG